ncbi:hypothetical protein T01_10627 [Trichinella spiralis]|uniref:Uncharacterized protein n=1 Tax=Trichinella spiralis TaxID=6334 RepID=A0A0V1BRV3_TRISP|nr:hypothetical protein T01_10627 [Trichinella spiralis]
MAICIIIAQGETSLQMLGKQINSQLMSNYWAHAWYLFEYLDESISGNIDSPVGKINKTIPVSIQTTQSLWNKWRLKMEYFLS